MWDLNLEQRREVRRPGQVRDAFDRLLPALGIEKQEGKQGRLAESREHGEMEEGKGSRPSQLDDEPRKRRKVEDAVKSEQSLPLVKEEDSLEHPSSTAPSPSSSSETPRFEKTTSSNPQALPKLQSVVSEEDIDILLNPTGLLPDQRLTVFHMRLEQCVVLLLELMGEVEKCSNQSWKSIAWDDMRMSWEEKLKTARTCGEVLALIRGFESCAVQWQLIDSVSFSCLLLILLHVA